MEISWVERVLVALISCGSNPMIEVTKAMEPKIISVDITFSSARFNEIRFKGWIILSASCIMQAPLMLTRAFLHDGR